MPESPELAPWLFNTITAHANGKYRHATVKEEVVHRDVIVLRLKVFITSVHNQAVEYYRNLVTPSLDPLLEGGPRDPATGYPTDLPMKTLQGYFGEIMAGIYAEHSEPFGVAGWQVPTYPLVLHEHAFNMLEKQRQTGKRPTAIPGQSGDDCLAFLLDAQDRIQRCLVCESKCTTSHSSTLISGAHSNLSDMVLRPVGLQKLISILRERIDIESQMWVDAIRRFYLSDPKSDDERLDLVMYVCGKSPTKRASWMSETEPHVNYVGNRQLEAVEMHISDLAKLLKAIYDKTP